MREVHEGAVLRRLPKTLLGAILLLGLLTALTLTLAQPAAATHVTPVTDPGNPKCPDGLTELKVEAVADGTFSDGTLTVTIDVRDTAAGQVFDWTSNIGVDVVIAKGGEQGGNIYTYNPEATGDTGLHAPLNPSGMWANLSHISFCYDIELAVTKTAVTTFNRDFDWTIVKSADADAVTLQPGDSATVNYSVVVTKDAGTDSGWSVSGTISVTNPHPSQTATNVVVTDVISGIGAVAVTCPSTSIAPGATLSCTYGPVALPDGSPRTNTATATSSNITGGSGTAPVTFGSPTTVQDNCVDISDTFAGGPQANICASQTFPYSRTFEWDDEPCGEVQVANTAALATDDGATETSSWTVVITRICADEPGDEGCTPGYWKNHPDSWAATGYAPSASLVSVFGASALTGSLLDALSFSGGGGLTGAKQVLLRAAVAALLNAAHPDVDYPLTEAQVISSVTTALASGSRSAMLALAAELDLANNAGCPLS